MMSMFLGCSSSSDTLTEWCWKNSLHQPWSSIFIVEEDHILLCRDKSIRKPRSVLQFCFFCMSLCCKIRRKTYFRTSWNKFDYLSVWRWWSCSLRDLGIIQMAVKILASVSISGMILALFSQEFLQVSLVRILLVYKIWDI